MKRYCLALLFSCTFFFAHSQITTSISNASAIGDTLTTYVIIDNLLSVGNFDLELNWNSDSLDLLSVSNYHDQLIGGYSELIDTLNYLNYQWSDIFNGTTGGLNIPSGDTLFEITFIAYNLPTFTFLSFSSYNFYDLFGNLLPSETEGGVLNFRPYPAPSTLLNGEYYWGDFDPGEGNATTIVAQDGDWNESIEYMFANSFFPS